MPRLRRLTFSAAPGPGSQTGWAGSGEAEVSTTIDGQVLRLHERGTFVPDGAAQGLRFQNVYRWHFDDTNIALAHERFGRQAAVALFDLVPAGARALVSQTAHHCGADDYAARLNLRADGFDLAWTITGPYKNEALHYAYRC